MNKNSVVTIIKYLNVTDLSGEKVMVDFEQGKYFLIKGVGNDIWDMLADGITVQQIVDKLMEEYDVARDVCEKEVVEFLDKLEKIDIIKTE